MQGWIKLHRKVMKSPMYRQLNSKQRDVMLTILLLANHESNTWEFKGDIYQVHPGQFITSLDSLKDNCASDLTTQNIRTALIKLEMHGFLTNESTKRNRLITVVNWANYQGSEDDANKATNRQLTNNQQTTNKQLTTNKNEKNDKNDKNEKNKDNKTYDQNFELFWNVYPKQVGQNECYKVWKKLIKNKEEPEKLINCAKNYAKQCQILNTIPQYIKHPKRFLDEGEYKYYIDEPIAITPHRQKHNGNYNQRPKASIEPFHSENSAPKPTEEELERMRETARLLDRDKATV